MCRSGILTAYHKLALDNMRMVYFIENLISQADSDTVSMHGKIKSVIKSCLLESGRFYLALTFIR